MSFYNNPFHTSSTIPAHPLHSSQPQSQPDPIESPEKPRNSRASLDEHLLKVFNTALISTAADTAKDHSQELHELIQTPAFQVILRATRYLSEHHHLSEKEAAETLVKTFRKLDHIWKNFVYQEGIEKIKNPKSPVPQPKSSFEDDF